MPTRAGYLTVTFGILCLVAGRLFGLFELYLIAAAALALVVCAVLWVLLNWRSLGVQRGVVPNRLHAGGESVVTLSLTNGRIIPTPVARVTDEVDGTPRADANVPPLSRGRVTRASYRVPAEVRGHIALGPMRTTVTDPFGLATTQRTSAPDAAVLVLPAYDEVAPPPQPSGRVAARADRSPGRIGAHGEEFSSLRSYVVGDDLRKVHWPSTARSGELVVRTEHVPEHGDTLVLLDVRAAVAGPDQFERMVSAATSVLIACRRRGDTLRFKTTGGVDLHADTDAEFDRIIDSLAVVRQSAGNEVQITTEGSSSTEASVLILGANDAFVDRIGPKHGVTADAYLLRFVEAGAKPAGAQGALPSRRMVTIGPDDNFAAHWSAMLGIAPRPSTSANAAGGAAGEVAG